MRHQDITVIRHHWGIECYAVIGPYLESRKYIGYSAREARAMFYKELKGGN